ncbi:hypothetical protein ScPMuIL_011092 [Solemya velum]
MSYIGFSNAECSHEEFLTTDNSPTVYIERIGPIDIDLLAASINPDDDTYMTTSAMKRGSTTWERTAAPSTTTHASNGQGTPTLNITSPKGSLSVEVPHGKEQLHPALPQIRHTLNGGEVQLPGTNFKLDGFCEEKNIKYSFGDFWHGCHLFSKSKVPAQIFQDEPINGGVIDT